MDGSQILATVSVAGTLQSAFCDTRPGDEGTIDWVNVFLNGGQAPFASIRTVTTKSRQDSFLRPFPLAAAFRETLQNVPVCLGTNLLKLTATDPTGVSGYAQYSAVVSGTPPKESLGHILQVELIGGPLKPGAANTIQATLLIKDAPFQQIQATTAALVETGPGTGIFQSQDGAFEVGLEAIPDRPASPFSAWVNFTPAAIANEQFLLRPVLDSNIPAREERALFSLTYLGDNTYLAEDDDFSNWSGWGMSASGTQAVGSTGAGVFNSYLIRLIGPERTLKQIDYARTAAGKRPVKRAFDGNYYLHSELPGGGWTPSIFQFNPGSDLKDFVLDGFDFYKGFVKGFYGGFVSMGEGLITLLTFAIKESLRLNPVGFVFVMRDGRDRYKPEREKLLEIGGFLRRVGKLYLDFLALEAERGEILIRWLTGQTDAQAISEPYVLLFELCAELIEAVLEQFLDAPPEKQGFVCGRITFEAVTVLIAELKVGQIAKLEFLTKLSEVQYFRAGEGARAFAKLADLLLGLRETRMCFVAGTEVHTETGLKKIEDIRPGDLILSRGEANGANALRKVLRTFVTHPTSLLRIHYEVQPGRATCEAVGCTEQHPFYVSEKKTFIAAADLAVGDVLHTANGSRARVLALLKEGAPRGGAFTTFNLEVEEFRTYFVSPQAIWVHNAGTAPCEQLFSLYYRSRRQLNKTVEQAWQSIEQDMFFAPKGAAVSTETMAAALEDIVAKEVFGRPASTVWTKGEFFRSPFGAGQNMWRHYKKHVIEEKQFSDVTNAVGYVKKARNFVDSFRPGGQFITWERPIRGGQCFLNTSTKEFAIQITTGPETGALKSYFKVTKPLRQYMMDNECPAHLLVP